MVPNAASIGRVASVGREDDLAKVETSGIAEGPKLARHGTSPETARGEIPSRVDSESVTASEPVVRRVPPTTVQGAELAPSSVLADVSLKANVYQQSPNRPVVEPRQTYWQRPESLLTRLDGLSVECATNAWANDVSWTLVRLSRLTKEEGEIASELLRSLHAALSQSEKLLLEIDRQDLRSTLQRTRYALQRRLTIWDLVLANNDALASGKQDRSQQDLQAVADRLKLDIRAVDQYFSHHSGSEQWNEYLLLDALRGLAYEPQQHPTRYRRAIVRKVLQRTVTSQLSEEQRTFLSVPVVLQLQETLRYWSDAHLANSELLKSLEMYESSTLVSDAQSLAKFNAELLLSSREEDRKLAMRLQERYHNANLRLAFSDQLLKRLIPSQPAEIVPVRDTIVSVPVRGHSLTDTELSIQFLPDHGALRFLLQARGQVFSRTISSSGPAVFKNVGHSAFESNKLIIVESQGIRVGPATAVAESDNTLLSVSTDFDSIPLVGSLVREVAISQHDAKRDAAHREVVGKLENRASSQFDRRVGELLALREQEIKDLLFQPLEKLQLPLHPVQMQTTEHRAVVRLRVANDYQLGSHTPRPQAPSDSLASVQVHQSVVNNFLDRLELSGKWFDLAGLHKHVSTKLGHGEREPPKGLERDVYLRFDKLNPVSVRFEKGLANLTLRFEQLRKGRRRWNNIEVRVAYRPVAQGLSLALQRESKPVVKMQRVAFGNRVALHGIFSKVFPSSPSVQLTHEAFINNPHLADTSFTQCVMVDGWLGIALAARDSVASAHVARNRATQRGSR